LYVKPRLQRANLKKRGSQKKEGSVAKPIGNTKRGES